MDSDVERNVGCSQPVSESASVPAPRELEPTSVATRSAETTSFGRTYGKAEVPPTNWNQNPDRK